MILGGRKSAFLHSRVIRFAHDLHSPSPPDCSICSAVPLWFKVSLTKVRFAGHSWSTSGANSAGVSTSTLTRISCGALPQLESTHACSFGTALVWRGRQVQQLFRIANHVERPNHAILNLERRSLHRSLRCVDDETGQTVDGRKAQREVLAPPRTWAFPHSVNQELRHPISAVDHVQRRTHLAATVGHDAHVACEQLRYCIE